MIPAAPVVVEASVAVKWVISEALTPEPDALLADHLGRSLLVPPHFSGEVTDALYRRVHRSTNPITPAESRAALQRFSASPFRRLSPRTSTSPPMTWPRRTAFPGFTTASTWCSPN